MDEAARERLRDEIVRTRGKLGPWYEALLRHDPDLLRRTHHFIRSTETDCPVPAGLKHLIWVAVDCVVTHVYPRGILLHARAALHHGATARQLTETLALAATSAARTMSVGLDVVLATLDEAGVPRPPAVAPAVEDAATSDAFAAQPGGAPPWFDRCFAIMPAYAARLAELARWDDDDAALDDKSRALILLGISACPAIADPADIAHHSRAAIASGASPAELLAVLRLVSAIGIHSLSIGILHIDEALDR